MSADPSFDLSPVAACVDEALSAIATLDGAALDVALRDTDVMTRRMGALRSAVIGRAIETKRHTADGHRRPGGWVAAMTGAGRQDAGVATRVASALSAMPKLRAAFDNGQVPFEAVEMITRRFHDDRVVDQLLASDEVLTNFSIGRSTDDVRRVMSGWDRMVDPGGAGDAAEQAHERRRVRIVRKDGEVRIYGRFGSAEGEALAAIHDRFAQREFDDDAAVASDGELPRSADQRSADALAAALRKADDRFSHDETACSGCGAPVPTPTGSREPLTNLLFDEESFRQWASGDAPEGPIDLDRLRGFAAGTADGAPVPADDIVRSMILGRVRVVVRRSDGVITYVGRRQRLFRGLLRDAVVLQHPACTWAGCGVPASHCEADHLHPHGEGGATEAANGGPACGHHNRFKAEHGYRTERGADGEWHVLRPDGASITGPPAPRHRPERNVELGAEPGVAPDSDGDAGVETGSTGESEADAA